MIIALIGNLGRGKTLSSMMLGHYLFYNTHYDRVVSNFETDLTTDYVSNPTQLDEKTKNVEGLYLLDELWAWMDSRESNQNSLMNELVINSRKRGCLIIYTVQDLSMVDKRLRNNTDYIGVCRHYDSSEVGSNHDVAQIQLFDDNGLPVNVFTYNAEIYYGTYDTEEEVATKSEGEMFREMIKTYKKRVKAEKFESKKELQSHLQLQKGLSGGQADRVSDEVFRQIRNEETVEDGFSDDDSDSDGNSEPQKDLSGMMEA